MLLDPDRDLNGASRRALTIAFILALTNISQVEAPNVIDTPLGMMGIQIKRAVLEVAAKHANQLILFLTRSEIRDVEDLLDRFVGSSLTLSNSAHYPLMLLNEPPAGPPRIVTCECGHSSECAVCERTTGGVA